MGYTPRVLVVGGGATGAGLARDLAIRGLDVTLVEKGRLANGATGRSQGLLHSGARFADSDPELASVCTEENRLLRDIAGHCVEETGGLFVSLPGDEDGYLDRKRVACEEASVEVEGLDGEEVGRLEPRVSSDADGGLFVPDATVDPFRLTVANARAAREYGASVETHTEVTDLVLEDGAVTGVELSRGDGETEAVRTDYVVNAAGPWAGNVAAMADVEVPVELSKGAMVVVNDRPTEAVVHRCRPRDEGDVLVPFDGRCILGTTDVAVDDPSADGGDGHEVDFLVEELSALVPELAEMRSIRSYWGIRPLARPTESGAGDGDVGTHRLFDHEARDGLWGMSTVVGGTLTTYRRIAEGVADHVCGKFGIDRACLTGTRPLPGSESEAVLESAMDEFGLDSRVVSRSADRLGSRTREVLDTAGPNPVVCACESVTRAEVRAALDDGTGERTDLHEVRIRTRASMGECQGGRCCHRLAAELHPEYPVPTVDGALSALYRERWRGQRHALWGDQLAEAMRTYALHATTMNRDADGDVDWNTDGDRDLDAFDDGPGWDRESSDSTGEVP